MGPITCGGCHAVCINGGFECWGCRGKTPDANVELLISMLRSKNHNDQFIRNRLATFAGLTIPDLDKLMEKRGAKPSYEE
jgi:coenzyme F420-reducing hydrogenase gamma subunit